MSASVRGPSRTSGASPFFSRLDIGTAILPPNFIAELHMGDAEHGPGPGVGVTCRMNADLWAKVTEVFGEALETSLDDRVALLARLRHEDPIVAWELDLLLAAHESPDGLLPD